MGDREEQTVRVRPPRAGPGSQGWGVLARHQPASRQEPGCESLGDRACLAPQVTTWMTARELVGEFLK